MLPPKSSYAPISATSDSQKNRKKGEKTKDSEDIGPNHTA